MIPDWQSFADTSARALANAEQGGKQGYAECLKAITRTAEFQKQGCLKSEWSFHAQMHGLMSHLLEPDMFADDRLFCTTYRADTGDTWNYAPKCFDHFKDLSQPKLNTVILLSVNQAEQKRDSPLYRICEQVAYQQYFHTPRENASAKVTGSDLPDMIKLLSKDTLDELNKYVETADVWLLLSFFASRQTDPAAGCSRFLTAILPFLTSMETS